MLGPVGAHQLYHIFVELVSVLLGLHVDEIHDDDSTHVPEPELAGDFFRCVLVDVERVLFLFLGLCPDAAVDVHDVQGFGRFDHEVGALLDGDDLSERALDLAADFEMVEDRFLAVIQFHDLFLIGRDEGNVPADLLVFPFVVDVDVGEFIVEQVPQDRGGLAVLGEERLHVLVSGEFFPGIFPFADQGLELRDEDGGVLAFRGGADDGSVIARENAPHERLKPSLFLFRGDFLGNAHLLGEGEEYNVASCQ